MCLIKSILSNIASEIPATKLDVLSQISKSILSSSNKITMLEISRYTKVVYRTVQRFFETENIPWAKLNFSLFHQFVPRKDSVFLLAGDEVIEKKAGKHTFGVAHFFSNLHKKVVASVAFMTLSIVDVEKRKSYPIATKQVIKPAKEKEAKTNPKKKKKKKEKRPKGRPKGSKNKAKKTSQDVQYIVLDTLLKSVITLFATYPEMVSCTYLTLDGYFGNQYYMRLAKKYEVELISKLKCTAALFLPFSGKRKKQGRTPKYGDKINVKNLSAKYHKSTKIENKFKYDFYQMNLWSKSYTDQMLNVVVIICQNIRTGKIGHCILFSTDLSLDYDKIVEYYGLRFQIEFNFRDAKQYFGLADFKNYKEVQVTNAMNLAFFMCNLSYILIENFKEQFSLDTVSILDLKAYYRTEYIANAAVNLKTKAKKALQFLNPNQIFSIAKNQAVNF